MPLEQKINILVLGKEGAGKTSLLRRLLYGKYETYTDQTLGASMLAHHTTVNGAKINAHITDMGGAERLRPLASAFYEQTDIFLFVCDIEAHRDYAYLKEIAQEIGNRPTLLIVTKSDKLVEPEHWMLACKAIVSMTEILHTGEPHFASAKNDKGEIKALFNGIYENVLLRREEEDLAKQVRPMRTPRFSLSTVPALAAMWVNKLAAEARREVQTGDTPLATIGVMRR